MKTIINVDIYSGLSFIPNQVFIPYKFEVYEHQPPNFYNEDKQKDNPDFKIDIIELAYSTARTLCSYHVTDKELYFDIISSLLSHFNIVERNKKDYFVINESRYQRLRDFSRTTRIGELAQAINALFVSKRLKFPFIIDFDLAKEKTKSTLNLQTKGKTPDFVVLNSNLTQIGLFESKGSAGQEPRITAKNGYLYKALKQIEDITSPLCIHNHIPSCVRFENNKNVTKAINKNQIKNSTIHYSLIKTECLNINESSILFNLHYASWFYLIGDFQRVDNILEDKLIDNILEENDNFYELDTTTDEKHPIFWVKERFRSNFISSYGEINTYLTITSRYFRDGELKIGIYKQVIDKLINFEKTKLNYPTVNTESLKRFPDGTLIQIKETKE